MRYIIWISNVSSQGDQCMVIPMIGLIMVMFIFDSASVVKKTGTGGTNSGGEEGV